jgi:hypothetical protein
MLINLCKIGVKFVDFMLTFVAKVTNQLSILISLKMALAQAKLKARSEASRQN